MGRSWQRDAWPLGRSCLAAFPVHRRKTRSPRVPPGWARGRCAGPRSETAARRRGGARRAQGIVARVADGRSDISCPDNGNLSSDIGGRVGRRSGNTRGGGRSLGSGPVSVSSVCESFQGGMAMGTIADVRWSRCRRGSVSDGYGGRCARGWRGSRSLRSRRVVLGMARWVRAHRFSRVIWRRPVRFVRHVLRAIGVAVYRWAAWLMAVVEPGWGWEEIANLVRREGRDGTTFFLARERVAHPLRFGPGRGAAKEGRREEHGFELDGGARLLVREVSGGYLVAFVESERWPGRRVGPESVRRGGRSEQSEQGMDRMDRAAVGYGVVLVGLGVAWRLWEAFGG